MLFSLSFSLSISALISFINNAIGTLFCFKSPNQCISSAVGSSSVRSTKTARLIFFTTSSVFSIRNVPNSVVSSIPAVSVITTGPSGKISMDLLTGSVVVPATSDTRDTG